MVEQMISDFKEALKGNLVSVTKFGTEGQPNNFLFVLDKLDFSILRAIKPLVLKHSKRAKIVPLFFTEEELMHGVDVFPLEFLDIKYPHEVLFGKDVINNVSFDKKQVRRQLEFELRSKLIHLRENFAWIKKPKELRQLLISAIPSLMPLFYGMLFLKDAKPPTELEPLFSAVAEKYKVDVAILKKVRALKDKSVNEDELNRLVAELMEFLSSMAIRIDKTKM